jgi:mannan endo-1,4-beta-mannosidase
MSEAANLLERLHRQSGRGVMFGHQDTAAYGIDWNGDAHRSDVKDVCGSWPAVYGWDLGGCENNKNKNIDGVLFDDMKRWIVEADARGGINTLSLHMDNPVTGQSVFNSTPAVASILPGGPKHKRFLGTLDLVAKYVQGLKRKDGSLIPVILRPFHEHNQHWPWWGRKAGSESEFITLWQMTVDHLRRTHGLRNVLFAYSPQDVSIESEYMEGYPGDDYVDVFGLDYYAVWDWQIAPLFGQALSLINRLADQHGKVAALTETGVDKVPIANWWTEYLLKALKHDEWSRKTVWALVWRNRDRDHHFAPFPGHPSAPDFCKFHEDHLTVFGPQDFD